MKGYKEYQLKKDVFGYAVYGKDGSIQCITDNQDGHGTINILGGHSTTN